MVKVKPAALKRYNLLSIHPFKICKRAMARLGGLTDTRSMTNIVCVCGGGGGGGGGGLVI